MVSSTSRQVTRKTNRLKLFICCNFLFSKERERNETNKYNQIKIHKNTTTLFYPLSSMFCVRRTDVSVVAQKQRRGRY
jgi:hypothetical protein